MNNKLVRIYFKVLGNALIVVWTKLGWYNLLTPDRENRHTVISAKRALQSFFYQRKKFLLLLLLHFCFSAPDRLILSHSRPTWPNPTPTCFLPAFRARSERAFLAEFNYTNFIHIHHESFLGRSQNTQEIGKIQVKLGNFEMRYNSTEFSNKLALARFSGGQIYK